MFDDPPVIATVCGYQCRYYPTIQSGAVFRFRRPRDGRPHPFEVSASRDGVMVSGHSDALRERGVADLALVLALAARVWDHLARDDRDAAGATALVLRAVPAVVGAEDDGDPD